MQYILWFIVGVILSIPYTLLANGSFENFLFTAFFGPPIALFLFIVWVMENQRLSSKDRKPHKFGSCYFWMLVTYFCLPIILNGISIAVRAAGYETAAYYIYTARYPSILGLFLVSLVCLIVASASASAYERVRLWSSGGTPPTSGPPSNNGLPQDLDNSRPDPDAPYPHNFQLVSV